MHIYVSIDLYILIHYGLLYDIEYSPLCYTIGLCYLYILCVIVFTSDSQSRPPLSTSPLANTHLFSMSASLFLFHKWVPLCHIIDSTYKWYYVAICLSLSDLFYLVNLWVHSCCCKFHFLWSNSILFCVCVCVYTHTPHIFIHSSVDGHLGCFCVPAIVNSAALNIGMNVSFQIKVLSDKCPGMELLDHMATLFLIFWGMPILFSIVTAPIFIPTNSIGEFSCLHTLSSICYL